MNTHEGGLKAAQTIKERYGEGHYQKIGALGGKAAYTGKRGFASMTPEQRRAAGSKGGSKSRLNRGFENPETLKKALKTRGVL
jgi:hypothetical protein